MTNITYIKVVEVRRTELLSTDTGLTAFFKGQQYKSVNLIFYSPSVRCTKTRSERHRIVQLSMAFCLNVKTKITQITLSQTGRITKVCRTELRTVQVPDTHGH